MAKNVNTRIKMKCDTAENWNKATNFIPYAGELILYSDARMLKIGDGSTVVSNLNFTDAAWAYRADRDTDGNLIDATYLKKSAVVSKGSSTTPVYFDSNGNAITLSYSLNKTVPSNAVFTDTTYSLNTGSGNTVTLTGSNGASYTRTINNVAYATSSGSATTATTASKTYWNGIQYDTYNRTGELGPLDQMLEPQVCGNRLAFIEPEHINIEYSQNGGSTWIDSGYSDDLKRQLFGDQYGTDHINIGTAYGASLPSSPSANQLMTRVTVTMPDVSGSGWGTYGRYCQINRLLLWAGTASHTVQIQVQYCTNADKNTYITWRDWTYISGNNGPNAMSLSPLLIFTAGSSAAYAIRFIVRIAAFSPEPSAPNFGNIRLSGSMAWGGAARSTLPYEWTSAADIMPRQISDHYPSLGASSRAWKDLYLRDAIYFGNGNGGMRILSGSNYYATVNCASGMLWTFADGGNSSNRNLNPEQDATRTLGTSSKRWKDLYLSGNLSDGTNSASISTLNNKLSSITFAVDQGDSETVTPDSTNHRITLNLNPGNHVTISKSAGTNLMSYNIAAEVPYISRSSAETSGSQTSSALAKIYALSGGTYGKIFNIYAVSSAANGTVLASSSASYSSNAYALAATKASASSQYLSICVFVPANTTYYFWGCYLSYYRVYSSTISLK